MVTLKDVAREAGLSFATVSHVLHRHDPRYSALTRRRVQRVAQRMGYRADAVARSMVQGKTYCIGVVGYSLSGQMSMERVESIVIRAQELGYQTFLAGRNEEGDMDLEKQLIEELLAHRVDGLIILIQSECDTTYYESLQRRKIPFVLQGHLTRPNALPVVSVDAEHGYYELTRHLLDLGHRDIAVPLGWYTARAPHNRLAGVQRALRERGLCLPQGRVLKDKLMSFETAYEFTREQMRQPSPPTAILYNNDEMALSGLRALREMGLDVPRDVSVAGYDDLPIAAHTWPPLTTARQPRAELGDATLQLLMEQLNGHPSSTENHRILKPKLIVRQSTGPVRSSRLGCSSRGNNRK